MGKLNNEIEEKCHDLIEENRILKQASHEQEIKIKRYLKIKFYI